MLIKTADGSATLHSERYNETFHSTNGAVTESRHVFLEAAGVNDRLIAGQATRVLEIGFGLGLNALITADAAHRSSTELEFHSLEHDASVLIQAQGLGYDRFLEHPPLAEALRIGLVDLCDELESGRGSGAGSSHTISLSGRISLTIHQTDAISWCIAAQNTGQPLFDAVYLDAFSPDSNPECWSTEFFSTIRQLMAPHAKLSTYSAKGVVRRSLQAAGFSVVKLPGPPGKREMMVACPIAR